jgi:hypothetical protein
MPIRAEDLLNVANLAIVVGQVVIGPGQVEMQHHQQRRIVAVFRQFQAIHEGFGSQQGITPYALKCADGPKGIRRFTGEIAFEGQRQAGDGIRYRTGGATIHHITRG